MRAAGRLHDAIDYTRRQQSIDHLAEGTHRTLLRRLAAAGEIATALQEHEAFRRRLWEELRVAPAPTTTDLARQLRSQAEAPDRTAARLPAWLVRSTACPFVGRGAALEGLRRSWRALDRDRTAVVCVIEGEPGIGKTRLAGEFAAELARADERVLCGAAEKETLVPGEPFREALDIPPTLPTAEFLAAVHDRLSDLAEHRPCAMVLDDLQWADTVTLGVLRRVLRSPYAGMLFLTCTFRTTDERSPHVAAVLSEIARFCRVERFVLTGLGDDESEALFRACTPDGSHESAPEVRQRTGGNPLFITELAAFLAGVPSTGTAVMGIPDAVRDLVAARVARLDEDSRAVLIVASVLGPRIDPRMLAAVLDDDVDVFGSLENLLGLGLLIEVGVDVVTFSHALVREAVYLSVSAARRADLHHRVIEELRSRSESDRERLIELALHSLAAVPTVSRADALAAAQRAVDEAFEWRAYDQAVVVLSRAIEVASDVDVQRLKVRRVVAFQRLQHQLLDPGDD